MPARLLTVAEAGAVLGVSRATVWRRIQRRELPSLRQGGRRFIPETALNGKRLRVRLRLRPFAAEDPMIRMAGSARSGGAGPGSTDKYAVLYGKP